MAQLSVGIIETIGLVTATLVADVCVKSANVNLIGYENSKGGGMITVKIEGDVAAVKAAVDASIVAVSNVGKIAGFKVIPRPSGSLDVMLKNKDTVGLKKEKSEEVKAEVLVTEVVVVEEVAVVEEVTPEVAEVTPEVVEVTPEVAEVIEIIEVAPEVAEVIEVAVVAETIEEVTEAVEVAPAKPAKSTKVASNKVKSKLSTSLEVILTSNDTADTKKKSEDKEEEIKEEASKIIEDIPVADPILAKEPEVVLVKEVIENNSPNPTTKRKNSKRQNNPKQ